MIGILSLVWNGCVASFKSRHQLLIENWTLRHRLLAAQNLLHAELLRARSLTPPGVNPDGEALGRSVRNLTKTRPLFSRLFCAEESRICLVLMTIALVLLTANAVRAVRTFNSGNDANNIWADLDSFSEPAVAQAVLKKDAETLLVNYTDQYNGYLQSVDAWKRNYVAWLGKTGRQDAPVNNKQFVAEYGPVPCFDTDAWLWRFKTTLSNLRERDTVESLEHTLLLIYERNRLWPEFIDLYLELVRKSPTSLDIVGWAEQALTHARDLGRVEQVLAYLQLAAQYDSNRMLANLAPILKRWNESSHSTSPLACSPIRTLPRRNG